ncbi:hypothetical protein [Streptomyces sp. WMMB 322]|uniref:hypothetical protein n=1 Tax=Streptomyces sp. WMMB 322 TaxID=1286821 RepID=UPI0008239F7B|nr:hypothetical protein [Streptomyces sp. WMMB 322]SCK13217.1 hypothetical protein H180DRAFT_00800 [Streptomyces sp. WMMB 322]
MARRRDTEKIVNDLSEIRRKLDEPVSGLPALQKHQEELRRKVLETVSAGTTGLREENRELRRRQERMINDLADTRTAMEALRREVAQAESHTPMTSTLDTAAAVEVQPQEPELMELRADASIYEPKEKKVDNDEGSVGHSDREIEDRQQPNGDPPAEPREDAAKPDTEASSSAVSPPIQAAASHADDEEELKRKHYQSLLSAAAIASARFICHRETWGFLIEQTAPHRHFRLPDRVTDAEDGRIETYLSGRSLLAVLVTMRRLLDANHRGEDDDTADWALAFAVYQRTSLAVTDCRITPDGDQVTTIVLDDRCASVDAA